MYEATERLIHIRDCHLDSRVTNKLSDVKHLCGSVPTHIECVEVVSLFRFQNLGPENQLVHIPNSVGEVINANRGLMATLALDVFNDELFEDVFFGFRVFAVFGKTV